MLNPLVKLTVGAASAMLASKAAAAKIDANNFMIACLLCMEKN